jgi:hypothetical protein
MLITGRLLILRGQQRTHREKQYGDEAAALNHHEISHGTKFPKPACRGASDRLQSLIRAVGIRPIFHLRKEAVSFLSSVRQALGGLFGCSSVCAIANQGNYTMRSFDPNGVTTGGQTLPLWRSFLQISFPTYLLYLELCLLTAPDSVG